MLSEVDQYYMFKLVHVLDLYQILTFS